MNFGPCPVGSAEGSILAHSVTLPDGRLQKGVRLTAEDCARLAAAGLATVTVARLDPGDVDEDSAARRIGACLTGAGLTAAEPFTGRVNIVAGAAGVLRVDTSRIAAFNGIDEALTLATTPDLARVAAHQLVATVKVIPYGVADTVVARGEAALGEGAFALAPFRGGRAVLIMTRTPGFRAALLDKGGRIVRDRVDALGYALADPVVVPHETGALAAALSDVSADLILVLGASATSDRADVVPAAVETAGGRVTRFGMPVDPGNLMVLADLGGTPVVGLPGCARSPALNGVDWVLERIAAGIALTPGDIAAMGVGGLLKEMAGRPQPRRP